MFGHDLGTGTRSAGEARGEQSVGRSSGSSVSGFHQDLPSGLQLPEHREQPTLKRRLDTHSVPHVIDGSRQPARSVGGERHRRGTAAPAPQQHASRPPRDERRARSGTTSCSPARPSSAAPQSKHPDGNRSIATAPSRMWTTMRRLQPLSRWGKAPLRTRRPRDHQRTRAIPGVSRDRASCRWPGPSAAGAAEDVPTCRQVQVPSRSVTIP
jgi:hypothetical protein